MEDQLTTHEDTSIISKAEKYVTNLLADLPDNMVYHNLGHTREVVKAADKIADYAGLNTEEKEILIIAAWFHDTGYKKSYKNHENESINFANAFCEENNYPEANKKQIIACIESTKVGEKPKTNLEFALNDADYAHLSKKSYFDRLYLLRNEIEKTTGEQIPEQEWFKENLDFLKKHEYYTEYGKVVLMAKKERNIQVQEKMLRKLSKLQDTMIEKDLNIDHEKLKELKKKLKKAEGRPDRGIETMFRLTSRNHLQLSSIADSKANILISVNSIIISIVIGGLIKALDTNPHLIIPTYITLTISVLTIIFSVIALRPNVTKGKFTRKDIEEKNTNLLFFGNFHSMEREDYQWGMMEMINDSHYLYSSLIDDIYFLGKVLGKKYRYLRISYNTFMLGIIVSVVAFVIANIIYSRSLSI